MRKRRFRLLGMLLPLALIVASCGADDEGGEQDDEEEGDFSALNYDESAQCGTDAYPGNLAGIEAVDRLTVRFTLCNPDVAFPSKVAFSAMSIFPSEALEEARDVPDGQPNPLVEAPIGTGPYALSAWERGNQVVLAANDDYWGEAPPFETVVFRWGTEAAQRRVELESFSVDAIDNVGTDDFEGIEGNADLQLIERDPLNVFYVGMNVDTPPFDNEQVRQAIGLALNRQTIVDNFYPRGSVAASQFLPPAIPGFVEDFTDFEFNRQQAIDLLAQAGFPDGFDIALSYRDVVRGYLPQPTVVGQDIANQLSEVGINVSLDLQESTTFLDNTQAGTVPFYMLGWGADYPDPTNFFDFHFGPGASQQFGTGFPDIHERLAAGGQTTDEAERDSIYAEVAELLAEHAPMIPVAYGGSAVAYKAQVEGAHASPLSNESIAAMSIEGQDQFVFMQNGEPGGLYCADETDGESLRVCEQINEALLGYEIGGTDVVEVLAESFEPNDDLTEWTFTLRDDVVFHDGSSLDANDVVESYRVMWDAADPRHKGRTGEYFYFSAFFGAFLNQPAE
ncbi:MAG: ABC transporter substrate-binding protein [Acidimicrobiales bacterium]